MRTTLRTMSAATLGRCSASASSPPARRTTHYYLQTVARGAEDYYLGSGEAPGYWLSGGAADLGVSGLVAAEQLRALLAPVDPRSGLELQLTSRPRSRLPGFDLTFSAPKSVSLLFALGNDDIATTVCARRTTRQSCKRWAISSGRPGTPAAAPAAGSAKPAAGSSRPRSGTERPGLAIRTCTRTQRGGCRSHHGVRGAGPAHRG